MYRLRQLKHFRPTHNNESDCAPKLSVALLHPPILLQQELGYLSDVAENQRHSQKALNYRVLLFFVLLSFSKIISSLFFLSHLLKNCNSLSCLISIFAICSPPFTAEILLSITVFWSFSFRRPLLLPEASPNLSVPFQSDSQCAVSLNKFHQCRPPCKNHCPASHSQKSTTVHAGSKQKQPPCSKRLN